MEITAQRNRRVAVADGLFEASWRAVHPELARRARHRAKGNIEHAQEWMSATAIKALLFFRRSPERIRDPQGFLFLVLDHVSLDGLRRSQREGRLFDRSIDLEFDHQAILAAHCPTALERAEWYEQLTQIARSVAQLPPKQQHLFEMTFVEERPYPEIAAELGITLPLVRKRVQLLRAALR